MNADSRPVSSFRPLPVARNVEELRSRVAEYRRGAERIGLVPTMGALHAGHLALVERARQTCDRVVATVFVNPKQFDRPDDLAAYPREEARDAGALANAGCDLLFAPPPAVMYPDSFATSVRVGRVTETLEGAHRPGHFEGVATVVTKLLLQALPDVGFFGEKDYQQLLTIRQLVQDLDIPVTIEGVPTVRESDGLALSSRNSNLDPRQREMAPALARVLHRTAATLATSDAEATRAIEEAERDLRMAGFDAVDYVALRDTRTFAPVERVTGPARLLAAAWLGPTRLIDNVPVWAESDRMG